MHPKEIAKNDITTALRHIFSESDKYNNGHLDVNELLSMLQLITKNSNITSPFDISDAQRVLQAFDEDGNGTVEDDEFIHWVTEGLKKTRKDRDAFALRNTLAQKLDLFLTAVGERASAYSTFVLKKNLNLTHIIENKEWVDYTISFDKGSLGVHLTSNKNGDCVVADIMETGQAATHNNSPTCSNTIKPGHHVIKIGKTSVGKLKIKNVLKLIKKSKRPVLIQFQYFKTFPKIKKPEKREAIRKKKLKHLGIRTIFREFDRNKNGHIDVNELNQLLKKIPERGGVVIASEFTKKDVGRVLEAFDEDGNGTVEEDEFVHWVSRGLSQTISSRQQFAKRTPLAGKLDRLLTAVEIVIKKWKRLEKLNAGRAERVDEKKSFRNTRRGMRRVQTFIPKKSKIHRGNGTNTGLQKSKSFHQPIFSSKNKNASSTANLSSSIFFDVRNVEFGRTVLRTSKKKSIHLINDTDYEISILLSLKPGSGFNIHKKVDLSNKGFQKFYVNARQQLVVPLRYRPLLLGQAHTSMIAKCTTINHGRVVFRAVTHLSGYGV